MTSAKSLFLFRSTETIATLVLSLVLTIVLTVGLSLRKPVSGVYHLREVPLSTRWGGNQPVNSRETLLSTENRDDPGGDIRANHTYRPGADHRHVHEEAITSSVASKVNWLTLKQAQDSARINPKPILIDLYTSWCGWCKVMDKKTYADKNVTEYLQRKFYAVKLDAESKGDLVWNGKTYRFNPNYRANDFSVFLTNGNLSFPTTVIIPDNIVGPQAIPGYLEPKDFEMIVKYFGEDKFGRIAFDVYQQTFKPTW